MASKGQDLTHFGSSAHKSQMETVFLLGSSVMAPNLHAAIHHPHPLHFFSSTCIMPFSLWSSAFVGHDVTHGAFSQSTQAMAMLP